MGRAFFVRKDGFVVPNLATNPIFLWQRASVMKKDSFVSKFSLDLDVPGIVEKHFECQTRSSAELHESEPWSIQKIQNIQSCPNRWFVGSFGFPCSILVQFALLSVNNPTKPSLGEMLRALYENRYKINRKYTKMNSKYKWVCDSSNTQTISLYHAPLGSIPSTRLFVIWKLI